MSETNDEFLRLVIFQINSPPFVTEVPADKASEIGEWILNGMNSGKQLVFRTGDGEDAQIIGAVRGLAISSFLFQDIVPMRDDDEELRSLNKEFLRLQVRELRSRNSGDEWKGY